MTQHNKADQARKGLIDSLKGKAKELVGAVTGNDSLTAEGQLEQTQARERKEANSVEAVADAEAEQARAEAADAKVEAAQERVAVNVEAAAVEGSVRAQQEADKRAAEQAERRTPPSRRRKPNSTLSTRWSGRRRSRVWMSGLPRARLPMLSTNNKTPNTSPPTPTKKPTGSGRVPPA